MTLDPKAQIFLERLAAEAAAAGPQPPLAERPSESVRRSFNALLSTFDHPPNPVARIDQLKIPGPAGSIPARMYIPEGKGPFPVLVYFHGGGWVIGTLDTHDTCCRELARSAGCAVLSVDYRLAPEHKFPAAAEDAYAATCWVAGQGGSLDIDPTRIAVGGDSAGGNLAAVVSLMARDRSGPRLCYQALVYPVTNYSFATASYRENADGYYLTREKMTISGTSICRTKPADGTLMLRRSRLPIWALCLRPSSLRPGMIRYGTRTMTTRTVCARRESRSRCCVTTA